METEDAVDEIDNTVHSAGSGTVYRHSADSSIESCNMSSENINDSVHSVYDNSKTRNNNDNNDDNIGNNCDNSHNSNNTNNNDDDDDNGITESGAVCVDEKPLMIIHNNKLDDDNNLSSEHFESSEVDNVVHNREVKNTVLVNDDIGKNWNDKNKNVIVCVDKTHNNNKTSYNVSEQKKYQENHSQKFQFKELDIAKKLSESILKKEYDIPMSPLLCSLSISPPHTPTRMREYLIPDAAKKGKLQSEISIQNLNDKLNISSVMNNVRVTEDYGIIDEENFHREFEAKYRRNVASNVEKSTSNSNDDDDDVFNIRMNDNDNDDNNSGNSHDDNRNDNDSNDNNDNDSNIISNNNHHNTNSPSPLCVGPLKIPSPSLLAVAVAVDEVVWAELNRLGDGSKVLEIFSMSDQKLQKKCPKNTDSNSNSISDNNTSICCGGESCVCGHEEKEDSHNDENDNNSNSGNCSMILVASYTIIPEKYRIISKQKTLQVINKSHENENENENKDKNKDGNNENKQYGDNNDGNNSHNTLIRCCESVKDINENEGRNDKNSNLSYLSNTIKIKQHNNQESGLETMISSGSYKNLTHTSIKKEEKEEKEEKEKEGKMFSTVDSLLTIHGFEIFSPHKKHNVNISLQKSSLNIITNSNLSNIKIKGKVENVLEEHSDNKKVISTSVSTVKIVRNEIASDIFNDNDNVDNDELGEWKIFWCESESDCAEWMLSLRSD